MDHLWTDQLTDLPQESCVLLQLGRRLDKHCIHDEVLAGDQVEGEPSKSLDGVAEAAAIRESHGEMGVSSNTTSACEEGRMRGGRGGEEGWRGMGGRKEIVSLNLCTKCQITGTCSSTSQRAPHEQAHKLTVSLT